MSRVAGADRRWRRGDHALPVAIAVVLLLALTAVVYLPALHHDFVNFDDEEFVTKNPNLRGGLTWGSVRWAFTTFYASNWVPLSWLSHLVDVGLFGIQPWGHHLVNVLLHCANTLLCFLVLRAMTGAAGRGLFVAALFALHPLHVESVAWVAERRDVLSTLFWLLTLGAYHRYALRPAAGRYLAALGFAALGLLAKPMLVTLPVVLLLLDAWPLGRLGGTGPGASRGGGWRPPVPRRLLLEKAPFAVLAAAAGVLTLFAQTAGGSVAGLETFSLGTRLLNAVFSLAAYLGKMFWPVGLAVFYPHPGSGLPVGRALLAGALLAFLTLAALRLRRRLPSLLAGWTWYLVTMLPVSGVVQVGAQAMADRYTYVPLLGPFLMLAWGLPEILPARRLPRAWLAAAAVAAVAVLAWATRVQLASWKNSVTLLTRAMAVASEGPGGSLRAGTWFLPYNLGNAWSDAGRYDLAEEAYRLAMRTDPRRAPPYFNLGNAYSAQGRLGEAVAMYREAVRLDPEYADAWYNLGNTCLLLGMTADSKQAFERAARIERGSSPSGAGRGGGGRGR